MAAAVIGMEPHKRSATIETMAGDQAVLGGRRVVTDVAGYRAPSECRALWAGFFERGSATELQAHNPSPFGDTPVANEAEFLEQGFRSGVGVGAALGRTALNLFGVRLDSTSTGGGDRIKGGRYGCACNTGTPGVDYP